jgi:trans-aconitate 2-methyltransferase
MEALGLAVLERLELAGDETVLDAGCGSGRITQALIERLPAGRVIALDASASMVEAAKRRLGPEADVELDEPVDAILSTATFHWISDHESLFARLHAALRPGGQLIAQCGGAGNIDVLRATANEVLADAPYAQHFLDWQAPWNYASAEQTQDPRAFLSTIVLGPHVQQLPEQLRDPFMDDVLAALGEPVVVDYVRLNIDANA